MHQRHLNPPGSPRGLPGGGDIPVEEFELARLRLDGGKYPMQGNSEFKNPLEGQSSGQSTENCGACHLAGGQGPVANDWPGVDGGGCSSTAKECGGYPEGFILQEF